MTERSADGTRVTKTPAGEETLRLLPSRWESFRNECRIMAMLDAAGPPIRVPRVELIDLDAGVLMTGWIDGPRLGPKRPTQLDPNDLARAVAIAQTIGRYWPPTANLHRLPVTDHLRHHLRRGSLSAENAIAIAAALAVRPIKWGFAHGDLTARNLIKEPSGRIAVIDWERAGIYPAGYDLAFLWYTTRDVPCARTTIESAVLAEHRTSFLLSALLAALLHLDRTLDTSDRRQPNPDREDADVLIAQLDEVAMEGSNDA